MFSIKKFIAIASLLLVINSNVLSETVLEDNIQRDVDEIHKLQQLVNADLTKLKSVKGEIEELTEYRVNVNSLKISKIITSLISDPQINDWQLIPIIHEQLSFSQKIETYFHQEIAKLELEITDNNNFPILLHISKIKKEQIYYLELQLKAIDWLEKLNGDSGNLRQKLILQLFEQGKEIQSLVNFIQLQLKDATTEVKDAGEHITSEQTSRLLNLRKWLEQNSELLNAIINLLDLLNQNTTILKNTLFSVSGDITQDVLNIDVASGLIHQWFESLKDFAIKFGPTLIFKLVMFLIILFMTSIIARIIEKFVQGTVKNSKLKLSRLLQDFFIKLSGKIVYIIGILIGLSQLGFQLGPLLAGFGIAGVIIGFALQDTLSNFASGMMILIYRPFDVGDSINAAGIKGKVNRMNLVSTTILTFDNQRLIVPNNKIWGDIINNITGENERRVDMVFGIGYSDDISHAEKVLMEIVTEHPKVLASPAPTIKLNTLNNSSVDFIVRPWTIPDDYWDVYWDITREVKIRFDEEGITIPFPQQDVHVYQKAI